VALLSGGHSRQRLAGDIIDDLGINMLTGEGHTEAGLSGYSADPQTNPGMNTMTTFAAVFGGIRHKKLG
jgi:hypothetical protein